MTEIVILPGAKNRVLIFTCECDLTPIAAQPILVTQKKNAASPLQSNSDSSPLRALLYQTFTLPVGYVSRISNDEMPPWNHCRRYKTKPVYGKSGRTALQCSTKYFGFSI